MNINQHNYEEFFLLYVDGELSAADKQAVEQFVQGNPGLADELETLQQIKLPQDAVFFEDKDILYRDETTGISLNNYEERFLLYVDKELSAGANEQVETFVLQHPALQEGFTLLKQTRLEPETILFPHKPSLYRRSAAEKPLFYLRWQRIAVAAAFTGFVILVWTLFPGNNPAPVQTIAKQQTVPQKSTEAKQPQNIAVGEASQTVVNNPATALNTVGRLLPVAVKKTSLPKNEVVENIPPDQANTIARNRSLPPAVNVKQESVIPDGSDPAETKRAIETPPVGHSSLVANTTAVKNNADDITAPNPVAQPSVYKELDTDDEKKSLYLGAIEINKDKFRGLFRKATSLFRGKAKQEDEKTEGNSSSNTRSLK